MKPVPIGGKTAIPVATALRIAKTTAAGPSATTAGSAKGGVMRPLKFRVYDKGRKQWVHDTDHAVSLFGEYVVMGEILRRPDDSTVSLSELNNLDAMQFTGLLDKNGKEIYEGDICKFLARPEKEVAWKDAQSLTGEVMWDAEDTGFFFATHKSGWPHIKFWFTELVEVISNIYDGGSDEKNG